MTDRRAKRGEMYGFGIPVTRAWGTLNHVAYKVI